MRAEILYFAPRAEVEPIANIEAFVTLCRNSAVLNAAEQFEKNVWEVGYLKGQNKVVRAIFSTLEAAALDVREPVFPMPFLNFAKATLVYAQDKRPVTSPAVRMAALRCIEAALRQEGKGSRPTAVDSSVLDSAVALARAQVGASAAYRIAGQIQFIAGFMCSMGFINLRQRWVHGLKKPNEMGSRISKEALKAREEKLPSVATLRALGGIFTEAFEFADVLVSSETALMLSAPERINEVVRLRRNCIVDGDGEFKGMVGLRWAGSKGFDNTTKWLPTAMAPIARQAVANILQATAPAHELAVWYTENPAKLYFHDAALHLRHKKALTSAEIALLLWGDGASANSGNVWASETNKLPKQDLGNGSIGYLLEDVERAVLSMLPETFPFVPGDPTLKCRDAMAIMRTNEMHAQKSTYLCMFSCIDHNAITLHFGVRGDRKSIFERFGYTEDDGSSIELKSHSLRHYLNTLAQTGGLSSTEIAIFSGRRDVKQNRVYDHMSSMAVQAPISQALGAGFTADLVPIARAGRKLVLRTEFNSIGLTAAHSTEFGWCAHDFAAEPCQMYRDCINCEEQECIKGEVTKERNLRLLKHETGCLLKQARKSLSQEEYGADNWVKHQSRTLERVNVLLSILEDPAVVEGARIRLDVSNGPLITSGHIQLTMPVNANRNEASK